MKMKMKIKNYTSIYQATTPLATNRIILLSCVPFLLELIKNRPFLPSASVALTFTLTRKDNPIYMLQIKSSLLKGSSLFHFHLTFSVSFYLFPPFFHYLLKSNMPAFFQLPHRFFTLPTHHIYVCRRKNHLRVVRNYRQRNRHRLLGPLHVTFCRRQCRHVRQ